MVSGWFLVYGSKPIIQPTKPLVWQLCTDWFLVFWFWSKPIIQPTQLLAGMWQKQFVRKKIGLKKISCGSGLNMYGHGSGFWSKPIIQPIQLLVGMC